MLKHLCFLLMLASTMAAAAQEPVFYLCSGNVADVAEDEGDPAVHVLLTAEGAEAFRLFSEKHQGQTIRIRVGNTEVTRFTIRTSGDGSPVRISVRPEQVGRRARPLREQLPETPCGQRPSVAK